MHIKFKLVKFESAIAFQILEMDERFRYNKNEKQRPCFKATNGLQIHSYIAVEIWKDSVFLRGLNSNADLSVVPKSFANNYERDAYVNKLIEALTEWSKEWEGFKSDKPILPDDVYSI